MSKKLAMIIKKSQKRVNRLRYFVSKETNSISIDKDSAIQVYKIIKKKLERSIT